MLTATKAANNIILSTQLTGYTLERRLNTGSWEPWNGTGWSGTPVILNVQNFTDYNLADGVYQYRAFLNEKYHYTSCVPIGSDPVGWTFRNYVIPEEQFGEILTADDLQYSFLWGQDLTASNGDPWTSEQSQTLIEWSVFQLEKKLNIDIFSRQYFCDDEQNEDIEEEEFVLKTFPYPNRRQRRYLIIMRQRPIQEVTRFDFFSPVDTKIFSLLKWMRLDRRKGRLWYYPKQGKLQSFSSNGYPWNYLLDAVNYPDAFRIDYKTGFKNAKLIPKDLREIIGKIAALKMLNVIGDGLLAGFSSSSLSLDGMSESFSSTQSATSVGGNMYVRFENKDVRIKDIYKNKFKYLDRKVFSINRTTNKPEFKECDYVYRHNVSKKKCYRIFVKTMGGDKSYVDITEDHSLFDPQMRELKGSDITTGTWLRTMYSQESKMKVFKVKRLFFRKYMYDLSVRDNENFTANGVMAHNSAYYGARIKVYENDVKNYIAENKNKYGNFIVGSI